MGLHKIELVTRLQFTQGIGHNNTPNGGCNEDAGCHQPIWRRQ